MSSYSPLYNIFWEIFVKNAAGLQVKKIKFTFQNKEDDKKFHC